jgi:hypothetical protein
MPGKMVMVTDPYDRPVFINFYLDQEFNWLMQISEARTTGYFCPNEGSYTE